MSMIIDDFISEIKERKDLQEFVHHERIPPRAAVYGEPKKPLSKEVAAALERLGIKSLYDHQAEGIDLVTAGRNTVVMTPTASGKSLIYNIPVVESLLEDPSSHALYIFPLKGLEQDQLKAFKELTEGMPLGAEPPAKTKGRKSFVP